MNQAVIVAAPVNSRLAALFQQGTRALLVMLSAIMMVAALHPDLRSAVRGTFLKDYRMIVSTAHGDLLGDGSDLTVAKVRTRDALFVEIYESSTNGGQRLLERIELLDKRDGYFTFNGQPTNLAIDDIDGDGSPEILVPSFDQNLIGHISIYRYDKNARGFMRAML